MSWRAPHRSLAELRQREQSKVWSLTRSGRGPRRRLQNFPIRRCPRRSTARSATARPACRARPPFGSCQQPGSPPVSTVASVRRAVRTGGNLAPVRRRDSAGSTTSRTGQTAERALRPRQAIVATTAGHSRRVTKGAETPAMSVAALSRPAAGGRRVPSGLDRHRPLRAPTVEGRQPRTSQPAHGGA